MTEFELKNEVSKFYNGYLDIPKCLKLYEIEHGHIPTLTEDNRVFVNTSILPENDSVLNEKSFIFMKELQESGSINMFTCRSVVAQSLFLTNEEAKSVVSFYMKNYTKLYYPEQMLG